MAEYLTRRGPGGTEIILPAIDESVSARSLAQDATRLYRVANECVDIEMADRLLVEANYYADQATTRNPNIFDELEI